ncbi:MAG: hypothetical protein U0894_15145 [Pirellulales bacterium]
MTADLQKRFATLIQTVILEKSTPAKAERLQATWRKQCLCFDDRMKAIVDARYAS